MDKETALKYLHNTLQPDGNIRQEAEKAIRSFIQTNFKDSMLMFIDIVLDSSISSPTRQICSIIVKNCLHSKNIRIQKSYELAWLECSAEFRNNFISTLNRGLCCKEIGILNNITKIYGSIIRIEVSNGTNIDIFKTLSQGISNTEYSIGILETISYACDQLYEETMYNFGEEKHAIYNIGMYFLNQDTKPSRDILFSSLKCILSCLEIYEDILSSEEARSSFLYKILSCEKIDSEISEICLDVINRFVDTYSMLSDHELTTICQFYMSYFNSAPEDIPLQVFDLWTLLLDSEKYHIINQFMGTLVPNLMLCISKEDPDDVSATPHKLACDLLLAISSKMKPNLLADEMYQNFVLNNLNSSNLEKHAIGYTGLGCIVGSGSNEFVYQIIPMLINDLGSSVCVNEALVAISRISESDIGLIANFLPTIVQKVGVLINSKSKTAVNAVLVYKSILLAMNTGIVKEVESVVLYHYSDILSVLICRLDQSSEGEYELRTALSITLSELIHHCPSSHKNVLDQLEEYLVSKIKSTISYINNSGEQQRLLIDESVCIYVLLLESCLSIRKIFDPVPTVDLFVQILSLPKMVVQGEVYIAISKLLTHFSIYLKRIIPFMIRDLSCDEIFVMKSALNLLSDSAILLEVNFVEFVSIVVPALANAITSTDVPLEVKPEVISALGNVALAIGKSFEPYISLCVLLFSQINTLNRENDEDYVDTLRKSAIQLFSCIIVSVGDTSEVRKTLYDIIDNLRISVQADKDNAYLKESLEILSDIQGVFGSEKINENWVIAFLQQTIRNSPLKEREKAKDILMTIF